MLENNRFEDNDRGERAGLLGRACHIAREPVGAVPMTQPMSSGVTGESMRGADLAESKQCGPVGEERGCGTRGRLKKLVQATETATSSGLETGVREEK